MEQLTHNAKLHYKYLAVSSNAIGLTKISPGFKDRNLKPLLVTAHMSFPDPTRPPNWRLQLLLLSLHIKAAP